MLEQLLEILNKEGVSNPAELAHRLQVSQDLVEQMLVFLAHAGKIQQVQGSFFVCSPGSCSINHPCSGCAASTYAREDR